MKYMLLIYSDEQAWSDAEREHCYEESTQFAHQLKASGKYLAAAPLQPVATATSVRVRDGKRLVTDGPFAETREQFRRLLPDRSKEPRRGHRHCRTDSRRARAPSKSGP